MAVRTLHRFQKEAVDSGVDVFLRAKELLDATPGDADSRARTVTHNGYLLVEAPTGSGKTLMAGHIVERFSKVENVVWFWFAPFSGVTGQTEATLREQFRGLKLLKRKLRIGVVVDEAHHSFHGETQAARFFHDVLSPEYTILVTATPDDADIEAFEKDMGIAELHRIRIGRLDAVEAGLIKDGVKCAAYLPDPDKEKLVDLEGVALQDAVRAHRKIKRLLADAGVSLIPLLLVQVDSGDDAAASKTERSVQRVRDRLLAMKFTEEQIAVHTAREPDPSLLALANDERREVLIFKMAVALGFDAPRAFTLVSTRATRDPDFGVQLVGRILRVHRLLQARSRDRKLAPELRHGYVFLAHASTQEGLDIAGQRINAVKTEYAKISDTTMLVRVGESTSVQCAADGQFQLIPDPPPAPPIARAGEQEPVGVAAEGEFVFASFLGSSPPTVGAGESGTPRSAPTPCGAFRYPLRSDVPRRFKTQIPMADNDVTEEECAHCFVVSTRDLLDALKGRIGVQRKTLEIFTHQLELDLVGADLDPARVARQAQAILGRSGVFDPRELRRALLRKMQAVMLDESMDGADDVEKVSFFLNIILSGHPHLLAEAQKAALAATATVTEAADLPAEIVSDHGLPTSGRNIYGIQPPGLNEWERQFAGMLDNDPAGVIWWWHRNLPNKPWAVNVLLPDGRGFYPDFVVGVEGRRTEDGVLLADPKRAFGDPNEAAKSTALHKAYGRVLILYRDNAARWMIVRYDERKRTPVLDREFRLSDAAGF